jgi:two-component system sensor histidine kinase UhpB
MNKKLQLLICEDLESDAAIIIRELEKEDFDINFHIVETATAMKAALDTQVWDIIISDFNIPGFGGFETLAVLKSTGMDIPFVLVSGTVGEEIAVNMMKAGAHDYIMKHNLKRLSEVVKRELIEAQHRKERKSVRQLIKANEEKYHAVIDNSLLAIFLGRPGGFILESNKAASSLFGYTEEEFKKLDRNKLLDFSDPALLNGIKKRDETGHASGECIGIKKGGEKFYCEISSVIFKDINGEDLACSMLADISARKNAEQMLMDTNEELKKLSNHLKDVREHERKYISREIHDQLGQLASALKIEIDWLNINLLNPDEKTRSRIEHALSIIKVMISSTRKMAAALRPSIIDELGLNESLKWQCNEFQKLNGIECHFTEDVDDTNMPIEIRTELFRICQESLTNVMRHANASKVEVSVKDTGNNIQLTISDNGKGFNTRNKSNHLGLIGIRERALSVKGESTISSKPGEGTTISILLPKTKKAI